MSFFYDETGVCGLLYNGATCYHYVKNLQGDIVALLDSRGTVVAKYLYDPWGVPTVTNANGTPITNPEHIGNLNPFRYRGYYYDKETGWYYLQSRYYDPTLRRFLNADIMDVLTASPMELIDKNLYAYCNGNPVMYSDPSGRAPKWIKNAAKWITKNVVAPIVKGVQSALANVDATYSVGINVSATPSAFLFNFQGGIAIDANGNIALQGTAGGGFTGGSPSAAITVYQTLTNAPTINKLNGPGYQIGCSAGAPVYGVPLVLGGDLNLIPDNELNTLYAGTTTNIGLGMPGAEFHVGWGETAPLKSTQFNIFDSVQSVCAKILEW